MTRGFQWFVAWRYLMAPRPRRVSEPIVAFVLATLFVMAFAKAFELWVPLAPPLAFGGPKLPPLFYFGAAVIPAMSLAFVGLALVIAVSNVGSGRTLRISLVMALLWGTCSLAIMGFYGAVQQGFAHGEPKTLALIGWGIQGLAVLAVLSVGTLASSFSSRVTLWFGAGLLLLAGLVVANLYGTLRAAALSVMPLHEVAFESWILLGLGVAITTGSLVSVALRSRALRAVLPTATVEQDDAPLRRVAPGSTDGSFAEALALVGGLIMVLGLFAQHGSMLEALGAPNLEMLGIDASEEYRPLWVVGALRSSIVLFSIAVALVVIRYYFSFFTTVSIGGVMVGTMALIMVLSVMSGFEGDLRKKILGSNAHILITKPDGDFEEYREIGEKVRGTLGVEAYSPFLVSEVVIAARQNYANVIIKGIDPTRVGQVTKIEEDIEQDFERPLDRLYPLAADGGVLGPPVDTGPERTAPEPKEEPNPVDPVPDDFDIPDFDPVDLSGGLQATEAADEETASSIGAARPGDLDPVPDDMAIPDDEPLDLSGGLTAKEIAEQGGQDSGVADDADDDMDVGFDELVTADELGLGELPPMGISPEIAELPGLLVGRELVKQLNNFVGQEVTVVSPLGQDTPLGPVPRTKRYRVAGTFYTGMYEYDLKYVYVELGTLQDFLDIGDQVNGIEIRVTDPNNTGPVMAALQELLGGEYRVQDWRDLNRSLFSALKLEKIAMFIVLAIIILVASFSIVGNLVMIVIEKAREIAVLKTLGASDRTVTNIFIAQGFVIGHVGMLVGVGLGIFHTLVTLDGFPLDANVYYIDRLPIQFELMSALWVSAAAIVISTLATLYPAQLAASQRPVDGLSRE